MTQDTEFEKWYSNHIKGYAACMSPKEYAQVVWNQGFRAGRLVQRDIDAGICTALIPEYTNTYPPGAEYLRHKDDVECAAAIREQEI